jgi:hypothetical protein
LGLLWILQSRLNQIQKKQLEAQRRSEICGIHSQTQPGENDLEFRNRSEFLYALPKSDASPQPPERLDLVGAKRKLISESYLKLADY